MDERSKAVPWLPTSCLTSHRAAEPFERIVKAWSGQWFGKGGWQVLGTWDAVGRPNAKDWAVLRDATRLRIKGKAMAMQSLALALLGVGKQAKYTDQDLRLMRRLAARALDDLQARIEESLGERLPPTFSSYGEADTSYSLLIGVVGGAQLAVECAAADLTNIVRQTFPVSENRKEELAMRDEGLTGQSVSISALIGEARLTVEQIDTLEIGDVVILDRRADEPVSLTIGGKQTDLPFSLGEDGGHITLELQELT